MEQFFKQVEKIISIADVDALSEKINAAGKGFKLEPYFEVNNLRFIIVYSIVFRCSLIFLEKKLN